MSSKHRFRDWHRFRDLRSGFLSAVLVIVSLVIAGTACHHGDDFFGIHNPGPYELVFSLDASFQSTHGGDPIQIAVLRSNGTVVAQSSGTISSTQNPCFTFMPGTVLQRGLGYEVHYWIDSNIAGGTLGVCDPVSIDHQWSVEFIFPLNDVNFTASYSPALTEDVCSTF